MYRGLKNVSLLILHSDSVARRGPKLGEMTHLLVSELHISSLNKDMRQIFVDSRDRSSGTSTDFSMALPQTLSIPSGHQARIDDLRIPNAIPTISSVNYKIEVEKNGQYHYFDLPWGQVQNGQALRDLLFSKLATITGEWTINYDANNMSLVIQHASDFTLGGSFFKQLTNRPYSRPDNRTYWFKFVPLHGMDVVYLCSPNFSHMDNVGPKGSSDVLCAIPITVGFGATQVYSMSTSVFFDIPAITTQQLSFQLRDRDYNIAVAVANISFTLTID